VQLGRTLFGADGPRPFDASERLRRAILPSWLSGPLQRRIDVVSNHLGLAQSHRRRAPAAPGHALKSALLTFRPLDEDAVAEKMSAAKSCVGPPPRSRAPSFAFALAYD